LVHVDEAVIKCTLLLKDQFYIDKAQVMIMIQHKITVAIAGATGFIGSRLCELLPKQFNTIALTRHQKKSTSQITWRTCDLYNLDSCLTALNGVDVAVYLVHSMMPSARLTQARFEDLDLILADNFARAAQRNGIKHIVYVGGLDPEVADTSTHLNSRMEVEQVLAKRVEKITALRAGLVIGAGGSSYEVLTDVVKKLPIILCPKWTESKMQPIALEDLVHLIRSALEQEGPSGCHDVCSPTVMTYKQLMKSAANQLGIKRIFIRSPIEAILISSFGVRLLTGKPISLIQPLLESLKHDMLARNTSFQESVLPHPMSFDEAFSIANETTQQPQNTKGKRKKEVKRLKEASAVRSVQRMLLPKNRDAFWLAEEYVRWLPRACRLLIRAEYVENGKNGISRMYLRGTKVLLLELTFQSNISSSHRAIYTISGGFLVKSNAKDKGTFEFRIMLDSPILLTAIHDFYPRLPWYLYTLTQARVHALVMKRFAHHLQSLSISYTQEH
jgi:uncharacterized protein YbjT (DUF2867 family)